MTLYETMHVFADEVELIVQDKSGKILDCFTVAEGKTLPYHRLFDEKVIERYYNSLNMRLLIKLDYVESEDTE